MEAMTRRDMMAALVAMAAMTGVAEGQQAVTPATALLPKGRGIFLTDASQIFRISEMPATPNANGGWGRAVIHVGRCRRASTWNATKTMLPARKMPHPPHKHPNTELLVLVREGQD